jgi:hypothetical protein
MGYAKKRTGRDGKPRFTAVDLDLRGAERSAGTFARRCDADRAWQSAESDLRAGRLGGRLGRFGRLGEPAPGRQSVESYVRERWLPHLVIDPTTREKYTYCLNAHTLPVLGPLRM